ncbi:MAG TPA: oligopeptide transporter, OPT family [Bdellovibrionota bacterium]|nr:oligopeptide transporter, OPT family [Bdellovibrionota bacterium]
MAPQTTEVGGGSQTQNAPAGANATGGAAGLSLPADVIAERLRATANKNTVLGTDGMRELTVPALLMGVFLGIVFGASSLYLALKVGMTVSASIPIAVLSITLFKGLTKVLGVRRTTILENNIVQTTGSAGESIAFGVAVTMPALLILGYEMEVSRILIVAGLGGLLGILMMIPLRHALIEKSKGLAFPEGTACAQVLIVGEKGGTSALTVFTGFFLGLFYKVANVGARLWTDAPEKAFTWFKGAAVSAEVSPELLGVGYIIGPRIASIMVAGGVLSSLVLIPAIKLFGDGLTTPLFPATKLISQMALHEIWRNYVLYIGAGAVAAGGIISLAQVLPTIFRSAFAAFGSMKESGLQTGAGERTQRDLSMKWVVLGVLALVAAITLTPALKMNLLGAVLIVIFGFLFVSVSSRLTGEIGSSSNPISGMTVATLLTTSLIFLALGWVSGDYRVTALSVAAIVCVAASNGGTTAQDLKTGQLVRATPRSQQIGILIGALTSAMVIGFTLQTLNDASTIYSKKAVPEGVIVPNVASLTTMQKVGGPEGRADSNLYHVLQLPEQPASGPLAALQPGKYLVDDAGKVRYLVDPGINGALAARDDGTKVAKYEAPKARLMSLIIDGILTQKLPWGLVLLGVAIALVLELCGIASLPFAVGVYLPISASAPIFLGGAVRWGVDKYVARKKAAAASQEDSDSSPGVLFSSGLIAGGAIAGIALAIAGINEGFGKTLTYFVDSFPGVAAMAANQTTAVVAFGAMMAVLFLVGIGKLLNQPEAK